MGDGWSRHGRLGGVGVRRLRSVLAATRQPGHDWSTPVEHSGAAGGAARIALATRPSRSGGPPSPVRPPGQLAQWPARWSAPITLSSPGESSDDPHVVVTRGERQSPPGVTGGVLDAPASLTRVPVRSGGVSDLFTWSWGRRPWRASATRRWTAGSSRRRPRPGQGGRSVPDGVGGPRPPSRSRSPTPTASSRSGDRQRRQRCAHLTPHGSSQPAVEIHSVSARGGVPSAAGSPRTPMTSSRSAVVTNDGAARGVARRPGHRQRSPERSCRPPKSRSTRMRRVRVGIRRATPAAGVRPGARHAERSGDGRLEEVVGADHGPQRGPAAGRGRRRFDPPRGDPTRSTWPRTTAATTVAVGWAYRRPEFGRPCRLGDAAGPPGFDPAATLTAGCERDRKLSVDDYGVWCRCRSRWRLRGRRRSGSCRACTKIYAKPGHCMTVRDVARDAVGNQRRATPARSSSQPAVAAAPRLTGVKLIQEDDRPPQSDEAPRHSAEAARDVGACRAGPAPERTQKVKGKAVRCGSRWSAGLDEDRAAIV